MKAYVINIDLLVPRSRSSAKVKIKYKGYISKKMAILGAFVFHKHILFFPCIHGKNCNFSCILIKLAQFVYIINKLNPNNLKKKSELELGKSSHSNDAINASRATQAIRGL